MTIYRYRLSYKIPEFWGERCQQITIDSRRRLTQENRLTLEQWIAHITMGDTGDDSDLPDCYLTRAALVAKSGWFSRLRDTYQLVSRIQPAPQRTFSKRRR